MKKIKMQLFGNFVLSNKDGKLEEQKIHSNKVIRILTYLIVNRNSILTHGQLIEVFWEDDSKNPENALKNLMYRIRNELKVLGNEKYICTLPGAYRWNPEIEVETDYEHFEMLASGLHLTENSQEKEKLCREIIDCYKGNVTAKIIDETWMLSRVVWYQSVYLEAVKELCDILEADKKWYEIEIICSNALNVNSLDEDIHCYLIKSMHGQKKYDLAMFQYEKAKKLFYENMGIGKTGKLLEVFQKIMSEPVQCMTDIKSFLEEVQEKEKDSGAFFCDYQIFRQICRVEMRRINRLGIKEFIILFTLYRSTDIWNKSNIDHGMIEGMRVLYRSIKESLRTEDVISKYSSTQIIVLLQIDTYEAVVKVAERVRKNFKNSIGNKRVELKYELAELSAFK